jgi:hypothetical protein
LECFAETEGLPILESLFRIIKFDSPTIRRYYKHKGHFYMSQNGKGSRSRPKSVNQKTWDNNWNRIFRKPKNVNNNRSKNK